MISATQDWANDPLRQMCFSPIKLALSKSFALKNCCIALHASVAKTNLVRCSRHRSIFCTDLLRLWLLLRGHGDDGRLIVSLTGVSQGGFMLAMA